MDEKESKSSIHQIEGALSRLSEVTLKQAFPSWEELSTRSLKYPDLYEPIKKSDAQGFSNVTKVWFGASLLAAASLSVVFLLSEYTKFTPESSLASSAVGSETIVQEKPAPLVGKVAYSKGDISLQKDGTTESTSIVKNQEIGIESGDLLIVGKNGILDIVFPNRTWLRISANSQVKILSSQSFSSSSQQTIEVHSGKVLIIADKLKKNASLSVLSGDVETQLRGTTFSVAYDGKGRNLVAVRDGAVSVKSKNANEPSVLEAGYQLAVVLDEPSVPAKLLPKEDKELKALQTQATLTGEADLFKQYARLELVRMEDGREYRGVILGQSETHLQIEMIDGVLEIPIGQVLETEKIR